MYRVFILLLLSPLTSFALENSQMKAYGNISRLYGGADVIGFAEGSLQENGPPHIAAIISFPDKNFASVQKIVLLRKTGGEIEAVTEGRNLNISTGWGLSIEKHSIILSWDDSCGAICHSSGSFQFKYRNGNYQLIGIEETGVFLVHERESSSKLISERTSWNLLTKTAYKYSNACTADEDNPWNCNGKSTKTNRTFNVKNIPNWNLSNFTPDEFWILREGLIK